MLAMKKAFDVNATGHELGPRISVSFERMCCHCSILTLRYPVLPPSVRNTAEMDDFMTKTINNVPISLIYVLIKFYRKE